MDATATRVWRSGIIVGWLLALPIAAVLSGVTPQLRAWIARALSVPEGASHKTPSEPMALAIHSPGEPTRASDAVAVGEENVEADDFDPHAPAAIDGLPSPLEGGWTGVGSGPGTLAEAVRPAESGVQPARRGSAAAPVFWGSHGAEKIDDPDGSATGNTDAGPPPGPGVEQASYEHADDGRRAGSSPERSADAAAPQLPAGGDRFAVLEQQLRVLGAIRYRLETWGAEGELFRFQCLMEVAEGSGRGRHFEATAPSALAAVERVLAEMYAFLDRVQDNVSAARLVGRRVRCVGTASQGAAGACIRGEKLLIYCDLAAWPAEVAQRQVEVMGLLSVASEAELAARGEGLAAAHASTSRPAAGSEVLLLKSACFRVLEGNGF